MNTKSIIEIFRGDDSDALGYQTIVGTIHTDLDLTGCKAVFRYLGFFQEFDPIPEDGKLTIVIPSASSMQFPPGFGYASLKVYDIDRKVRTFTNRIPVFVKTMTSCRGGGEFDVEFSPFPELEPLRIFIGPNADDFDQYTGFVSKIIDRASLVKYGLVMLADAMSEDGGNSGKAASPLAVKAAYDAIIKELTDNYYNAEQTDEAIDRVAAYYITRNAAGDAFETKAQLDSTTVFYSGGDVRVPTRNDYCVVLADETHQGAEYRYIYAVAEGQTTGSWQPQFPVEGVMTVDQTVTKNSTNPVSSGGVWSAIWGALAALPTGFLSLYDWCVSQLAGKLNNTTDTMSGSLTVSDTLTVGSRERGSTIGTKSTAEGINTTASGDFSHAEGSNTTAQNLAEHAQGRVNASHKASDDFGNAGNTLSSIGFGSRTSGRRNAVETMQDGKTFIYGLGGYDGTNPTATGVKDLAAEVNVKASRAEPNHTGNLAALDASGNPTDSTIPAANVAVKGNIPYDLVSKAIIDNAVVTLDDHASNSVTISAALVRDTLIVHFPTATSGKVRDFAMRLNIAAGVTAPEIAWPQGVTLENDGGEVPEIADGGTGGSSTILYFSETENDGTTAKFLVKGEALTAITQA